MNPTEPYVDDLFDGSWAEEWVASDGLQRTKSFDHIVRDRLLKAIGDPEEEAQKASNAFWNEKMSEPVGEDGEADAGAIADVANDKAIQTYELLFPLRQSALNLGTVGLFHLFEQTCTGLGRAWKRGECKKLEHFLDWLRDTLGIDLKSQQFWPHVHELHMVANVIKHGEGWSADELRKINPAIFHFPGTHGFMSDVTLSPVAAPLGGDDLYVTDADYERYVTGVESLWEWLGAQLKGNHWYLPKSVGDGD
jgi:hypothetical protein